MTKTKSTKRALLMSGLALLMCVSMLIGSTFAWFTDSVTSAGNKIQSGTLKLDLELYDAENKTWNSIKESKAPIFDYDLWEPGYTDVKILKVENEGTLALKWIAKFVSGEKLSILADVIDVYVKPSATELTYPADRNLEGYERVGTVAEFVNTIEQTTYGSLKAGEAAYLGIALKMQETAGNDYQGLSLGAFDIMILATQDTVESDSFDDQYDAGAEYPSFTDKWDGTVDDEWNNENTETELIINTAEELAAFAAQVNSGNAFAGKTVKLGVDIDLMSREWTPIGNSTTSFKGIFDGQGHTISNMVINNTEGTASLRVGLFGYIENATIKNVTIQNANITAKSNDVIVAVLAPYAKGSNALSNIAVNGANIIAESKNANVYAAGVVGYGVQLTMSDIKVSDVKLNATAPNSKAAFASALVGDSTADGKARSLDAFDISNVEINAKANNTYIGGAFGEFIYGNMTVTNGTVDDLKINSNATTASNVGGLFGYTHKADPTKVENVTVTNIDIDFTGSGSKVGGIVGLERSPSRNDGYKNVTVQGSITENTTGSSSSEVGGFVGVSHEYPKTYTDCSADVDVNTKYVGGGFTGSSCVNGWGGGQYDTYVNCSTSGDVTAPFAGGFIAHSINHSGYVSMKDITVSGNIHGTTMAGGIIATTTGSAKSITINKAKITGNITGGTVAGVCANTLLASGQTITLTDVTSTVTPLVIGSADKVVIN